MQFCTCRLCLEVVVRVHVHHHYFVSLVSVCKNVCVQSDMALHVDVYSFALFVLIGCMCICVYMCTLFVFV